MVGNSLARAFGLAGALTIVRFRTVIKDPKDIAFVFWSLVIGIGVGTTKYGVALVGTVFTALVILVLYRGNFGSVFRREYILRFVRDRAQGGDENVERLFADHFRRSVLHVMSVLEGEAMEYSYEVAFRDEATQDRFVRELGALAGVSGVHLLRAADDVEY